MTNDDTDIAQEADQIAANAQAALDAFRAQTHELDTQLEGDLKALAKDPIEKELGKVDREALAHLEKDTEQFLTDVDHLHAKDIAQEEADMADDVTDQAGPPPAAE